MTSHFKEMLLAAIAIIAVASCEVEKPDFFVPEVSTAQADFDTNLQFAQNGGSVTVEIKANCDWTVSCPADWITLSHTSGSKDFALTISMGETRTARTTTVTVASVEVETKCVEFKISQSGVKEISSVAVPTISGTSSVLGNAAAFSSSFQSLGIEETDVIKAGFLVEGTGYSKEVEAVIDNATSAFTATVNDLTANASYTCKAWASINDGTKVYSTTAAEFTTESAAATISAVGAVTAENLSSEDGSTATLNSSYTASVTLDSNASFTAGFTVTPSEGEAFDVEATIDYVNASFTANLTGLVKGLDYTASAWVVLDGNKTSSEASSFKTSGQAPAPTAGTYDFTFESDAWGAIPQDQATVKGNQAVYEVIENGYTWKLSGCYREDTSLRIGSSNKIDFDGYLILPQFAGLTVTKIVIPNDGKSASGKACLEIQVSEDNGNTWTVAAAGAKLSDNSGEFVLSGQKPGSLYKAVNVNAGSQGVSSTLKISITVE